MKPQTKNEDWTLFLIICLIAVAIFSSCNAQKEVLILPKGLLWSRTINKGIISPWIIDVERNPVRDTTIYIDSLTGYVQFKYKLIKIK